MQRLKREDVVQRLDGVRRTNLAVVSRTIDRLSVASQTAIVEATGLANGAASSLLTQLREIGLVVPADNAATGSAGRPRREVRIAPNFALAVGVEVSVESITMRICGTDGTVLANGYERTSGPLEESPRALALDVFARFNELMRATGLPDVPASMVLSVPGVVAEHHLSVPPFGWTHGSVDDLVRAAPLKVRHLSVLNDGDAAVIAEASLRPAVECVAALHGSDGIGGGVSLQGRLFSGAGGAAGQFGHVIVEDKGRPCYCGNYGCLRQYVSISAFARDLSEQDRLASSGFRQYARDLAERASESDAPVLALLQEARDRLTQLVATLGAVLSPEVVVLTGNLAPLAAWLQSPPAARSGADEYRAQWARPIEGSTLGQDSVINGATIAARNEIIADPLAYAALT
jgi:predicted NBD/HSP70 family sugar kinase